jgi:fatty-acyl-CoA synthase
LFQYIGELCRYLLRTQESPYEARHRIRLASGNGLKRDIWNEFRERFRIPRLLEFYAATEGNVSFFNVDEQPGSVGRTPAYLLHRFNTALINFDFEAEAPFRNEQGFCVPCGPNEIGEAIGLIPRDTLNFGARFEGYTNTEASERKILRDVFTPGDAWFRTGDLMRKDEKGFLYFVDRIGDTFRWKGENVSTSEVSSVLCGFPCVLQANVYGVPVPGTDGRAGMATLQTAGVVDLKDLHFYLSSQLPAYARPLFLRFGNSVQVTSTFKYTNQALRQQGYNPHAISDPLYVDFENGGYIHLDAALYEQIQSGYLNLRRPRGYSLLAHRCA